MSAGAGPRPTGGWGARIRGAGWRAAVPALLVVLFLGHFHRLGEKALWSRGEGRQSLVAARMIETGDWVVPQTYERTVLTKPPLPYWSIAAAFELAGRSYWAARLPAALAGALTCVLAWLVGAALGQPRRGAVAALILATAPRILWNARTMQIDSLLACFVALTWLAYLRWRAAGGRIGLGAVAMMAAGMAGGLMTKGPVALVYSLPGFWLLRGDRLGRRAGAEGAGTRAPRGVSGRVAVMLVMAASLLIGVPWLVRAIQRVSAMPEVRSEYAREGSGTFFGFTEEDHEYSLIEYVPRLLADFFPWSLLLPVAILLCWREVRRERDPLARVAAVWFACVFVFHTVMPKKAPRYLLSAYPALALLTAAIWTGAGADRAADVRGWMERYWTWLRRGLTLVLAAAAVAVGSGLFAAGMRLWQARAVAENRQEAAVLAWLAGTGTSLQWGAPLVIVLVLVVMWAARDGARRAWRGAAAGLAALGLGAHLAFVELALPVIDGALSSEPFAARLRPLLENGARLCSFLEYSYATRYELPFLLRRGIEHLTLPEQVAGLVGSGSPAVVYCRSGDEAQLPELRAYGWERLDGGTFAGHSVVIWHFPPELAAGAAPAAGP